MKFTETRKVWVDQYTNPEEITGKTSGRLIITSLDMASMGYSEVGTAQVVIELTDRETMVANKVTSLKAQLKDDMAAAEVRQSSLRDKISKLLAITYEATV
jgi:hypothetical protein